MFQIPIWYSVDVTLHFTPFNLKNSYKLDLCELFFSIPHPQPWLAPYFSIKIQCLLNRTLYFVFSTSNFLCWLREDIQSCSNKISALNWNHYVSFNILTLEFSIRSLKKFSFSFLFISSYFLHGCGCQMHILHVTKTTYSYILLSFQFFMYFIWSYNSLLI